MHRQRNFLLSGGCFIREAGCSNRAECRFEIIDIEFFAIICPSSLRVLIILVLRRMIGEATSSPVEITITKATPTGEPKYTRITTRGKTLKDAAAQRKRSAERAA